MIRNVLVLDDHPNILILLERILKLNDHNVYAFERPEKALEFLLTTDIKMDIMFIDFMLPIMDGLEVAQEIKSYEQFSGIPIYMISSHNGDLIRKKADEILTNGFIDKPINSKQLLSIVDSL